MTPTLTFVLALGLAQPVQSTASSDFVRPPVSDTSGMIEIRVGGQLAHERVEKWLLTSTERVATQTQLAASESLDGWTFHVDVSGSAYAYELAVYATRGDTEVGAVAPQLCECKSDVFTETVEQRLTDLIAEVQRVSASAAEEAPPEPTTATTDPLPSQGSPPPDPEPSGSPPPSARGKLGVVGGVGIATTILGAPAFAYGLTRAIQGTDRSAFPQGEDLTHWQTPTTNALLGVGAVLIAGGVAMILVDQLVCKRRPPGCKKISPVTQGQRAPLSFSF